MPIKTKSLPIITYTKHLMETKIRLILVLLLSLFINTRCTHSEEDQVKETCNRFLKGRIKLKKGDSSFLKSVVDDSLYYLIMLHQQYEEVLRKDNVPILSADLNIYPVSVEIKGNCATCFMSGMEYYQINLCKETGIWKVKGENGLYPTPDRIAEVKKKLINYKAFLENKPLSDSVLKVVNVFWDSINNYFKTQNVASLKETCSKATIDFIQQLEVYAKKRIGFAELLNEMEKPDYTTGDVKREIDNVIYTFCKEEITIILQKENHTYKIVGFNGLESKQITEVIIHNQYLGFLRAMRLITPKFYREKTLK